MVFVSACPSHNEAFLMSLVACRMVIAVERRNTCGVTRLAASDGTARAAAAT